jgi:hypothetical protein
MYGLNKFGTFFTRGKRPELSWPITVVIGRKKPQVSIEPIKAELIKIRPESTLII